MHPYDHKRWSFVNNNRFKNGRLPLSIILRAPSADRTASRSRPNGQTNWFEVVEDARRRPRRAEERAGRDGDREPRASTRAALWSRRRAAARADHCRWRRRQPLSIPISFHLPTIMQCRLFLSTYTTTSTYILCRYLTAYLNYWLNRYGKYVIIIHVGSSVGEYQSKSKGWMWFICSSLVGKRSHLTLILFGR